MIAGSHDCWHWGEMRENIAVFHSCYHYSAYPGSPPREGSKLHDGLETHPYPRAIQGLEFGEPNNNHDPTLCGWK
jgi:hypothetical protein